jgi:hypothetical protein
MKFQSFHSWLPDHSRFRFPDMKRRPGQFGECRHLQMKVSEVNKSNECEILLETREAWITILDGLAPLKPDEGIELRIRGPSDLGLLHFLRREKRTQSKHTRQRRRSRKAKN